MKQLIIFGFIGLTFLSCRKEKTYFHFSEKQLVFVNYSKGQNLKFIDTFSVVQTLEQYQFRREFHEQVGLYGKTGALFEEYEVSYFSQNNGNLNLEINLNVGQSPSLNLTFSSYHNSSKPDSLQPALPGLTINGKVYTEVYTLKMYKNRQHVNNNDTATLFHNKQYGVIQLVFPNGKRIVRTD